MEIYELINEYGEPYSPYVGGLTNHLPMGQLALYKMGVSVEKVKVYTDIYTKKVAIDPVLKSGVEVNSLKEALGHVRLYDATVDYFKKEIAKSGVDETVKNVLNQYPYSIATHLFHTIIRLAYAIEGYKMDSKSTDEVARSLSYYVTAYKEVKPVATKISEESFFNCAKTIYLNHELKKAIDRSTKFKNILDNVLEDKDFKNNAKIIRGDEETKIKALLNFCLYIYNRNRNFLVLHFITGLHGLIVLREFYEDFNLVLDVYTTSILAFLVTIDDTELNNPERLADMNWEEILEKGKEAIDVHSIKFTYTCHELYKRYELKELKNAAQRKLL